MAICRCKAYHFPHRSRSGRCGAQEGPGDAKKAEADLQALLPAAKLLKALQALSQGHELAPAHHADFHSALAGAQQADPRIASSVHLYKPEEYAGMKTFLSADKQSGYAIKPHGEIVSVFSAARGRGDHIMRHAIQNGGQHGDCFDGPLPGIYAKYGFKEVRREKNRTPGGPDVVYMSRSANG